MLDLDNICDPQGVGDAQSHNLLGQRLGRKGRDTRQRILAAMQRLVTGSDRSGETALSLTAVAREASVGMTTLYLYFADMSELLLAALEPLNVEITALSERFDRRWPDATLDVESRAFLDAHHMFWTRHSLLLHLRNSFADRGDRRMVEARQAMSQPFMACLIRQMGDRSATDAPRSWNYAVALLTMLERMATITTEQGFSATPMHADHGNHGNHAAAFVEDTLAAQARIIALTIRDRG